jgi:hypothetical protein
MLSALLISCYTACQISYAEQGFQISVKLTYMRFMENSCTLSCNMFTEADYILFTSRRRELMGHVLFLLCIIIYKSQVQYIPTK